MPRLKLQTQRHLYKALPFAERSARLDQLRNKFTGLSIEGQGEPSHALLDETCSQFEQRTLKYLEPARCTSRENEIVTGKTDEKLKLDVGSLQIKESRSIQDETVSTTYHLALCLRRRGLAYEFANLISYGVHEKYVEQLLRHLHIDPPPGYAATTMTQVLRADKEVFTFLNHNVTDIRPLADGTRPLDAVLMNAMKDYNTTFHLLPLPKAASSSGADSKLLVGLPIEFYDGNVKGLKTQSWCEQKEMEGVLLLLCESHSLDVNLMLRS